MAPKDVRLTPTLYKRRSKKRAETAKWCAPNTPLIEMIWRLSARLRRDREAVVQPFSECSKLLLNRFEKEGYASGAAAGAGGSSVRNRRLLAAILPLRSIPSS